MHQTLRAALWALWALAPALASSAPCKPAPLGDTVLYLRGGLNNWAAQDEQAFEYRCDAYYLNLNARGTQAFKIADEEWTATSTFGGNAEGQPQRGAPANLERSFSGTHTLRVRLKRRRARPVAGGPADLQAHAASADP